MISGPGGEQDQWSSAPSDPECPRQASQPETEAVDSPAAQEL